MKPVRKLEIFTNSAEKQWRSCPRAYELSYIQLVRPLHDGDALVFGDRAHKALEAWWRSALEHPPVPCPSCSGMDPDADMPSLCQTCFGGGVYGPHLWLEAAMAALATDSDPWRRVTLEALMLGYASRWGAMRWEGAPYNGASIDVIAVEIEFKGPMLNPATGAASKTWGRGGKLDVLVRVAGDVWVVEHKTTSEDFTAGTPYRARLRLDTQVSGYHVGARMLGAGDVAGVLYDVIGKPSIRPHKATPMDKRKYTKPSKAEPIPRLYAGQRAEDETIEEYRHRLLDAIGSEPDDYFARFPVVRLAEEERQAAKDTWQHAEAIRDARRLGRFPRNPSACNAYGRVCAYMPICLGETSANDGTRYRTAETAHEELGEKAA